MNKIFSVVGTLALASVMGLASIVPSVAAPLSASKPAISSGIEQVQYHRPRPQDDRRDDRGRHNDARRYRAGNWNGYHGYRDARPGYRRGSDGWWYPLGAFSIRIR